MAAAGDTRPMPEGGVYLVLTAPRCSPEQLTEEAVRLAVPFVQVREKELDDDELLTLSRRLSEIARGSNTRIIINDRPDIAARSGADGVHLGRTDTPIAQAREIVGKKLIGLSAATPEELGAALAAGADYVGAGPVYPTTTKKTGREPLGLRTVRELACMPERPPLVAIGGIGIGRVREVFAAGADFAAVVSAVCAADNPIAALRDLVAMVDTGSHPGTSGIEDIDAQINHEGLRHCPRCASPLRAWQVRDSVRLTCASCGYVLYLPPAPVTCTIVERDGQVLMVKRRYSPGEGLWCLPAGFVEPGEHPAESAVREVEEETGLRTEILRLFDTWASSEDPRTPVVSIAYVARVVGGTLEAGDDASEAVFFPMNRLPEDIAFETHRRALARYVAARNRQ